MVKKVKITVSLPRPVQTWLREMADQRFLSTSEYLRDVIVQLYVAAQQGPERKPGAILSSSTPIAQRHKTAEPRPTVSGFKGVYSYGRRWAAVISANGGQQRLGTFDTPEDAARAYDAALIARAGGDVTAATNFTSEQERKDKAANAPYLAKLVRHEQLTDIEYAQWRKATEGGVPSDDRSSRPTVPPVPPKQLRRGSAGTIPRPAAIAPEPDLDDES
jgi:Arc/MetJ-type ribon-helix-helix transcriptional regulator